jgi:hypothetical protein
MSSCSRGSRDSGFPAKGAEPPPRWLRSSDRYRSHSDRRRYIACYQDGTDRICPAPPYTRRIIYLACSPTSPPPGDPYGVAYFLFANRNRVRSCQIASYLAFNMPHRHLLRSHLAHFAFTYQIPSLSYTARDLHWNKVLSIDSSFLCARALLLLKRGLLLSLSRLRTFPRSFLASALPLLPLFFFLTHYCVHRSWQPRWDLRTGNRGKHRVPQLFYASTECDSQATRYNKMGKSAIPQ